MDKRKDYGFESSVPQTQPAEKPAEKQAERGEPTEFTKNAPQQPIGQAQPAPAGTTIKAPPAFAMIALQGSRKTPYGIGEEMDAGDLHGLVEGVHFTFNRAQAGVNPTEAPKPIEGGGARKALISIVASSEKTYQIGETVPEEHLKGLTPGVHVE